MFEIIGKRGCGKSFNLPSMIQEELNILDNDFSQRVALISPTSSYTYRFSVPNLDSEDSRIKLYSFAEFFRYSGMFDEDYIAVDEIHILFDELTRKLHYGSIKTDVAADLIKHLSNKLIGYADGPRNWVKDTAIGEIGYLDRFLKVFKMKLDDCKHYDSETFRTIWLERDPVRGFRGYECYPFRAIKTKIDIDIV